MSAPDSQLEQLVAQMLKEFGEDPGREGLARTPQRVAKAWRYLTQGYQQDPHRILNEAIFEENYNEMVVVRDIDFYSMCEHHLLPFFGRAHVAYVPDGRVVGLSKLARLVEMFSRRLQVQERLTSEVADEISKVLRPKGVAVVMEALHLCMMMRGIQKQNSYTVTSAMLGEFESDPKTRDELMQLLQKPRVL